ncbi:unnamed protein product, partial [Porites evermanni]
LTPLLYACDECSIEMVEHIINRPECTKEQRIDALELLGATIANNDKSCDTEKAFSYMKRGMQMRYEDAAHPLLKKKMEPVEAYQNRKESQTLEELALLEGDDHAIGLEGLIIRERILGPDNLVNLPKIVNQAFVLGKAEKYELCIGLLLRGLEKAMNINVVAITEVLESLTVVFGGREKESIRLRPIYIDDAFEKLVAISEKRTEKLKSKTSQEEQEKTLYFALYLLMIYTEVKGQNANMTDFLQRFLRLNPRTNDGNTLLHLAAWHGTPTYSNTDQELPCVETVKLILHAGCNVNAVNSDGNTPLHLAVTFKPADPKEVVILSEMLLLLLEIGADPKLPNKNWQTPLHSCETDEARRILSQKRGLSAMNVDVGDVRKLDGFLHLCIRLNVVSGIQMYYYRDGQLRQMTQQLTNVQGQLQERDGQLRQMTQQLTNVQGQLQERDGQLRQMTQQLTNVQGQLQERDGQLRQMTQQLTNVQGQLQERDGQLRQTTQQLTNVQGQLQERDGQLRQMTQQLTNVQGQLQERDGQLRQTTQQLTNVQGQPHERDGQLRQTTQQLTNVQGQLQTELRQVTQQLTNVQGQLQERDGQLRQMTQQLTNFQGQLQERDGELRQMTQQEKEQQVNELETSLSRAQQPLRGRPRQQSPDWVISRDQIQLTEKCLGKGGWGSVVEGKYCGCTVAVKQIYEALLSSHNRELFDREISIASKCRHPCMLQFIGATNDEGSPLLVTELMESSLRKLLKQRSLSTAEVAVISLDVARAVNYLHQKKPHPIIHRDISSANVLLWRQADQWRGKVADYGAANFMQHTMSVCPGAVIYSAPEAITENQTVKVDVYSFGVLLCEMSIRTPPNPDRRDEQVAMVTDRMFRALIRRCLRQDPQDRPSMEDIIGELEKLV